MKFLNRLNIGLVLAAITGAGLSVQRANEVWKLRTRHDELARDYGYLPIDDPGKPCFVRMRTDDPMHYRWRFFVPAKFKARIVDGDGSSNGFSSFDSAEFLADIRFRIVDGRLKAYRNFHGGSSLFTIGSTEFAEFIDDRWTQLDVRVAGSDGPVVVDVEEPTRIIQIRLPESLLEDARKELTERELSRFKESILTLRFGSSAAFGP